MPSTYNENHWIANSDYVVNARNTLSGRLFAATVDQLRIVRFARRLSRRAGRARLGRAAGVDRPPMSRPAEDDPTLTRQRRQRGDDGVHAQQHQRSGRRHTAGGRLRDDGGGPAVPAAAGGDGARAAGHVPSLRHQSQRQPLPDRDLLVGRQPVVGAGQAADPGGGFFLTQYNGRADTGGARGKITFQTFADFLLG